MSEPYVAIIAPFKTATTSLNTALFNLGIRSLKYHGFNDELAQEYPPDKFTHVFLLVRDLTSTYISAYFQDIENEHYLYYYGTKEEVLEASVEELIDHFHSFDWRLFPHVNHDYFYECIQKYFEVELRKLREDEKYYVVENNGRFIVVLRTEFLDESISNICSEVGLPMLNIEKHNNSVDKWYWKKYQEMKERLFPSGER